MFRSSIRLLGDRQADRLPAALLLSFRSAAIRGISRSTRAFLFLAQTAIKGDELGVGGEGTQRVAWALSGEWQCDRDGENGKQDEAHGVSPKEFLERRPTKSGLHYLCSGQESNLQGVAPEGF